MTKNALRTLAVSSTSAPTLTGGDPVRCVFSG